ncbi:MAG: hypothetical protein ACTHQQ_07850 [Solirubrobacteraceae bacterium]
MTRGSLAGRVVQAAAIVVGSVVVLSGCGGSDRNPQLAALPLVRGAHVASKVRVCDRGSNHYCALELVLTAPDYASPRDFVLAESKLLRAHGWSGASAQTGDELADESPGNKLRLTYATAYGDLHDIEFGWVQRTRRTEKALSSQMFAGAVAISAQLQVGSQ